MDWHLRQGSVPIHACKQAFEAGIWRMLVVWDAQQSAVRWESGQQGSCRGVSCLLIKTLLSDYLI